MALEAPVALFIFRRPEATRRVFDRIRQARPARLLVVADGPSPSRAGEAELCAQARAVAGAVDWPCQVERDYSAENLGCKRRMASGLNWVFSRCEEAIILEDDCLPDLSFFPYCAELLSRYRDEPRVMMVSGDNFQGGARRGDASYYFSAYHHIWGWASWRRAWQHYDVDMQAWPAARASGLLHRALADPVAEAVWERDLQRAFEGKVDTWDLQWLFCCWRLGALCPLPNVNLVTNIGAGPGGTHMGGQGEAFEVPAGAMPFPLRHPQAMAADRQADWRTFHEVFFHTTARIRWAIRLKRLLGLAI
jgi:hypothetical protein